MTDDVNVLKRKARDWALKVVELHNTPVPPEFESKKTALLSTAKKIKSAIEKIVGTVPELDPMNQLGAIPLVIGVVGVAGAAAAIVKWTYDYNTLKLKIADRNALIASGVSPQAAAEITSSAAGGPFTDTLKDVFGKTQNLVALGVAGLGLYYLINSRR